MKPNRVYYLAGATLPSRSASGVHVAYMTQALARQVDELTLFAKRGGEADLAAYYGLTHPPRFELTEFRDRLSLLTYLRQVWRAPRPDLALGRYVYPLLLTALCGVPTVYEVHAPPAGATLWAERMLLRSGALTAVVFITEALRDFYRAKYPDLACQMLVLPDAANDPGSYELPRAEGPLRVGYVGSWYAGRGVELIAELARRMPDMAFIAAGGTADELASQGIAVPANLHCLGYVDPADTDEVLRNTDVLLAPYHRKIRVAGNVGDTAAWSSPMKFFEYMAHGKAIVCSDLPVFHEVFEHRRNCLLVEPEDIEQWLEAVSMLDREREVARALGQAARRQFEARHTWDRRAAELLQAVGGPV